MAVVSLLTDPGSRARLHAAMRGSAVALYECTSVAEARTRLSAGPVRLLAVGYVDARGIPLSAFVADTRRDYPSTTVVAFWAPGVDPSDRMLELARAGPHALVMRGVDDEPRILRLMIRDAEHRCTAELVLRRLEGQLPPPVLPLVTLYLRCVGPPPSVTEAAASLGVHRKTLVNRLASAGFPPPRALRMDVRESWCAGLAEVLEATPGRQLTVRFAHPANPSVGSLPGQA